MNDLPKEDLTLSVVSETPSPGWARKEGTFANFSEVMVNGPDDVNVEREGRIEELANSRLRASQEREEP